MTALLLPPPAEHVYGWRRSLPGLFYPGADTAGLTTRDEVDPRAKMPPALNQLALGSCTANATNRSFRYDTIMDGKDCGELSRLWTYYFERALEGTLGQGDAGAMGHDAFTVAKSGIPDELLYPYDISKFEDKPPALPSAYTLTKDVAEVPQDEESVKQVLSNDQTVSIGFTVYQSFEETWAKTGIMPEPKPGERILGGHEILICGFLKEYPNLFLGLNSWSPEWGLAGYFLFPKATLLNPNIASDFRTVVRSLGV